MKSREQLKLEIQRLIEKAPENILVDIHKVLKEFADKNTTDTIVLSDNLRKILTEDRRLLERLAK